MSLMVVVLGMHRSGTSCLANLLHQAGLYLGADLKGGVGSDNLEGYWEAQEAVQINTRILTLSGGEWDQVPSQLKSDEEATARMVRFLDSLGRHPVAGWKDPRTTLTFPLWKPHLDQYRIVACLRHPLSVARSLQVREGWTLEKGLSLWAAYNERLLQHVENEPEAYWFDFDAPYEELVETVPFLCQRLGLQFDPGVLQVFNPYLRHHNRAEPTADPHVNSLYERLREYARPRPFQRQARVVSTGDSGRSTVPLPATPSGTGEDSVLDKGPGSFSSSPPRLQETLATAVDLLRLLVQPRSEELLRPVGELAARLDQLSASCEQLNVRLAQLARIQQLQDEVQQRQGRWLSALKKNMVPRLDDQISKVANLFQSVQGFPQLHTKKLGQLQTELAALQARQQELAKRVLECQSFVSRVRGNIVFRIRRALARWIKERVSGRGEPMPPPGPTPSTPGTASCQNLGDQRANRQPGQEAA